MGVKDEGSANDMKGKGIDEDVSGRGNGRFMGDYNIDRYIVNW